MFGWNVYVSGAPQRVAEVSAARDGGAVLSTHGLMAGTRVASNLGWRAVESVAVGDKVLTFDNAMQTVVAIRRSHMWVDATDVPQGQWPVIVPSGAMNNRVDLELLPDQGVMIECDAATDIQGDPFAVVPARALEGLHGIHRRAPQRQVELITLFFEGEEVVYTEGGFLIHCPRMVVPLDDMVRTEEAVYDVLPLQDAKFLIECLVVEAKLREDPTLGGALPQAMSA